METFKYPDSWPENWPINNNGYCSLCGEPITKSMEDHMIRCHPDKLAGLEFQTDDGETFKFNEDGKKVLESKIILGEKFIREKRVLDFLENKKQAMSTNYHYVINSIVKDLKSGKYLDVDSSSMQTPEEKKDDFREKYLRIMADLENFRERVKKDKETWTQQSIQSFAKELIDAVDNLDLALQATEKHTENLDVYDTTFLKGVQSIKDQLNNILLQRNIEKIDVKEGDEFNPDIHNVLLMSEEEGIEGQIVGMVLRPGYSMKGKILRPTQIQLLKGKEE